VALFVLAGPVAAQGSVVERVSLGFEATSLAYGIVAESPRIALPAMVPLNGPWSIHASPDVAWAGKREAVIQR
jgi:hypothetical protein